MVKTKQKQTKKKVKNAENVIKKNVMKINWSAASLGGQLIKANVCFICLESLKSEHHGYLSPSISS